MTFRVGHTTVHLETISRKEADKRRIFGCYIPSRKTIQVQDDLPDDEQAKVIWHELFHALWDVYDLPEHVSEEELCTLLDGPITQLIGDNLEIITKLASVHPARVEKPKSRKACSRTRARS
jgi:hypothetical protein